MADSKDMTKLVEKITTNMKFRDGAWEKVIGLARKYELFRLTGRYIESDGKMLCVNKSEQKTYEEILLKDLLTSISEACIEDTLLGQSIK